MSELKDRPLYRIMRPDGGRPRLGGKATCLGVRVLRSTGLDDIPVDKFNRVQPESGGMSVSPDTWATLPEPFLDAVRDASEDEQIWHIFESQLGPDLRYRSDPRREGHGFTEPSRAMSLSSYERALAATQTKWTLDYVPDILRG